LIASVGVAPNKFVTKIAGDLKKPSGFVVLPTLFEDVERSKLRKVDSVSDRNAERFGKISLRRAIGLDEPPR
jgi:nucleotidyltransferase/DNA polymerase involved in DNA repair